MEDVLDLYARPEDPRRPVVCVDETSKPLNFNHYRPALYFSSNLDKFESFLTESELERFQNAFDALNKLLVS